VIRALAVLRHVPKAQFLPVSPRLRLTLTHPTDLMNRLANQSWPIALSVHVTDMYECWPCGSGTREISERTKARNVRYR
jgi:hypothetical protein